MVASQTPLAFLVIAPWPTLGMSDADSRTVWACGAAMRKVTFLSAPTSTDVTGGGPPRPAPRPPWAGACADEGTATSTLATSVPANESARTMRIMTSSNVNHIPPSHRTFEPSNPFRSMLPCGGACDQVPVYGCGGCLLRGDAAD